jgi:hypothetical protein
MQYLLHFLYFTVLLLVGAFHVTGIYPAPNHNMADQAAAKRILQDLIKREDLKNKSCADCSNPNPQWASLRFDRNSCCARWRVFNHTCQLCSVSVLAMCWYTPRIRRSYQVHVCYVSPFQQVD